MKVHIMMSGWGKSDRTIKACAAFDAELYWTALDPRDDPKGFRPVAITDIMIASDNGWNFRQVSPARPVTLGERFRAVWDVFWGHRP